MRGCRLIDETEECVGLLRLDRESVDPVDHRGCNRLSV
jgi:hypothetical protein